MDAETLVRPVVEGAGLDLVDVSFDRGSGRRILRVVVDREGGVDLDTIAQLSEKVSRRLDLEGFEPGPYALEVSSPGLERPLRRPGDFRRAVGERVRLRIGSDVLEGALTAAGDDEIRMAVDGEERRIDPAEVASAKTVADWEAELKRSNR